MAELCSCGARLVEDARFCHRCGKPTFEPLLEDEAEQAAETQGEAAAAPTPVDTLSPALAALGDITFSNGHAVRIGLIVAACAVLIFVPLSQAIGLSFLGIFFLTIASGLLAVLLYQRRTGAVLSAKQGARLGWITGIFIFLIFLVLFTISLIPALESGELARVPDEALRGKLPPADIEQVKKILANPLLLSASILFFMAIYFVGATVLTSLGGMLGAKFLRRDAGTSR
ncbi:MAG: hypothetical protein NW208_00130 [Bryobacter sp.]|nr:hypothetical protein [Bryobacter sp.]